MLEPVRDAVVLGRILRAHGLRYFAKFFPLGNLLKGKIFQGLIDLFVGLLELVSELSRMVSFTFRLFGNIFAGSVLMLIAILLLYFNSDLRQLNAQQLQVAGFTQEEIAEIVSRWTGIPLAPGPRP